MFVVTENFKIFPLRLEKAILEGELGVVSEIIDNNKQLVNNPMRIASKNTELTPFELSIHSGDFRIIKYFLSNGANLSRNFTGTKISTFHYIRSNYINIFNKIVHELPLPLIKSIQNCKSDSINDLKKYIARNGNYVINLPSRNGFTLFHYAILMNRIDMVSFLMENGANIDVLPIIDDKAVSIQEFLSLNGKVLSDQSYSIISNLSEA